MPPAIPQKDIRQDGIYIWHLKYKLHPKSFYLTFRMQFTIYDTASKAGNNRHSQGFKLSHCRSLCHCRQCHIADLQKTRQDSQTPLPLRQTHKCYYLSNRRFITFAGGRSFLSSLAIKSI